MTDDPPDPDTHLCSDHGGERPTVLDLPHQCRTLDMLVDLEAKLGHRLSLDSVATASLGVGKTGDGLDAIRWWREGKLREQQACA